MRSSTAEKLTDRQGVGGRHEIKPLPHGGGGYLCSCTPSSFSVQARDDPRLSELQQIGLGSVWIDLAAHLGVDTFLVVWKVLDQVNDGMGGAARPRIRVPLFDRWERRQRNLFIVALASEGVPPREIRRRLELDLCEQISERHVCRIAARARG